MSVKVPEFKWHLIEDRQPFEIEDTGIKITPFAGTCGDALCTFECAARD